MAVAVSKNNMQVLGTIVALAEAERSFRDIQGFIERSLSAAQKYWFVLPMLAAGWSFMVADEERFQVLEGIADSVLDVLPIESGLEKMLGAANGAGA
jgi:hypothetical protein